MDYKQFENICPYDNSQLRPMLEKLLAEPVLQQIIAHYYPVPFEQVKAGLLQETDIATFQQRWVKPLLDQLEQQASRGIEVSGLDELPAQPFLYLSNHRDIVLDSAFLDLSLFRHGRDSVEIGIGDNLLIYPWIYDLVRLNRAFIVRRSGTARELYTHSQELSAYIHYAIEEKHNSVWLAQREGRAKDSNDLTQESVLKMLAMSSDKPFLEAIGSLNICPVSISYEYDPCDYLKAREFQLKRDVPGYQKTPADDLQNMQTGIFGYKGHIAYSFAGSINAELPTIAAATAQKNEQATLVAQLIDRQIHSHYAIYAVNKIALDLHDGTTRFAAQYTAQEREAFEQYMQQQIDKIELDNKDVDFLRERMLAMYANPLRNYLQATQN